MTSKYNPYQVICKGINCEYYKDCQNECVLESRMMKKIKGCHYVNDKDCKYCSHKNQCVVVKPYSDELFKIELKRVRLEKENRELYGYISKWDEIEKNLDEYGDDKLVTDVVYFKRNKQQMVSKIINNNKLIKAYLKKENSLI